MSILDLLNFCFLDPWRRKGKEYLELIHDSVYLPEMLLTLKPAYVGMEEALK